MSSNNIIVQEYLSSLKEDKELDYLFPILLNAMGYRIIQTAKESKGQSQYGKDIIAVGKDDTGKKFKWYFELKGYQDRDITDLNYSSKDGIRESIIEAKDTAFKDCSIPVLNDLPTKIVIVHNGVLKSNIRPTFDGFISREFKEGEFERWDIYQLTDLFSKYIFSEYLLADNESNRLFKRTLVFLDAVDYNFIDFKQLVEIQFEKTIKIKGRTLQKLFATLNLLSSIIFHYSKENNNLIAAKECSSFIVLKTWAWILKNRYEKKRIIIKEFKKLLNTQYLIYNAYFKKTFPIASIENGLFSENGTFFESVGYPLRCFDYVSDLIYYCQLRIFFSNSFKIKQITELIRNKQKDKIIELINNNRGCLRPILDNHSIPILQLFLFFSDRKDLRQKDVDFITAYIFGIIDGLLIIKTRRGRLPELYNRINLVIEFSATKIRPEEYCDESSMLISIILEILCIFNAKNSYEIFKNHLTEKINLQIAHPNFKDFDIEQEMFEHHMDEEYYVESFSQLPESFEEFKIKVKSKEFTIHNYRTDKEGFSLLRTLAHSYYKNEIFPDEWRRIISET